MRTIPYRKVSTFLPTLLCLMALSLGAQEVDKAELERSDPSGIVFINYEGPSTRNETVEEIAEIGRELGRAVRNGARRAGSAYRYYVIHSISAAEGQKKDADIIGLGVDVGVNHIRNLREILRGYLEEAYAYNSKDARLLAEFITIYNAVYRGNQAVFTERYKTAVVAELPPEQAGLSVRYDQWPGQTRMVIPLALAEAGRLSAIDTTPLTDEKVIDEVRKQDDLGIETRKEMVDLKERESDEAAQKATLEREAIREEEQRIAAEKKALDEEKARQDAEAKRIAEEKKALEAQKKDPEADKAVIEQKEKEIAREEKALEEERSVTEEKKETLEKEEQAVEEQKKEADKEEALAEKKGDEAAKEREDIAEDKQTLITKEEQEAQDALAYGKPGIALIYPNSSVARIVLIDQRDGSELRRSGIDTLQGRSVSATADAIYAIAGGSDGKLRIVSIDPQKLEVSAQSTDLVHISSLLWVQGSDLYAVITAEDKNWFARFDRNLKRVARSSIPVHAWASPLFLENGLLTLQNEAGQAVLMRSSDLSVQKN